MKDTLATILSETRFLGPTVPYSILPSMVSLPSFIFFMLFLSSFKKFYKPAIHLKNLIRYQMRKSLNVLTAESMAYLEIYIPWSVLFQSSVLPRPLGETSSKCHLSFLKICASSMCIDGDEYFGPPILD